MASTPQPSATPDDPAGYDTSTNLHGFISPHVSTIANGYQVPGKEADQYNSRNAIAHLPNGVVASGTSVQTTTGYRHAQDMPAGPTSVKA